jgi:hypothetical protein
LQIEDNTLEITMALPSLVAQTTYAELLERCANAAFKDAFADDGAFISKTIKGRKYWYFQTRTGETRTQRYVGPETPELLTQIAHHKEIRDDERERRALVSTLVRALAVSRPLPDVAHVIAAFAKAGVFRLRAVLVGTVAYQTYPAMLGVRLPAGALQTGDIDIAQFKNVSVAIGESTPPAIDILNQVDSTFRAVPHVVDGRRVTSYLAKGGVRVDFLTPIEGGDTDKPQSLPALQTDAQPLRFLDFLIHDPEPAVILHGPGIYVQVPAPARYAVHKLSVSRRRSAGLAKSDKDLQQADALLAVLGQKRPDELRLAWIEAHGRGPSWRLLLNQGLSAVSGTGRDWLLKVTDGRRSAIPNLNLTFDNPPIQYDFTRDVATFVGQALGSTVKCEISREALDDHFGTDGMDQTGRVEAVRKNRSKIEEIARIKYLSWRVEEPAVVLIRTMEVPKLLRKAGGSG